MSVRKRTVSRIGALLLALVMMLSLLPTSVLATGSAEESSYSSDYSVRSLFVDCGRKYFDVDWFKDIIDEMAANHMNTLFMSFSNDEGFRFLLDDMSLSFDNGRGTTVSYTNEQMRHIGDNPESVTEGSYLAQVNAGDDAALARVVSNYDTNGCLTQSEMVEIIAYAQANGISVIPEFNGPGHMGQLLWYFPAYRENGLWWSDGQPHYSLNVGNAEAVNFAKALIQKYVDFFKAQGCTGFAVGGDEYANSGGHTAEEIAAYTNSLIDYVQSKGMTAYCWNDGQAVTSGLVDGEAVILCWSGVPTNVNNKVINFNSDKLYYVLKNYNWKPNLTDWTPMTFNGTAPSADRVLGASLAVWCDVPNKETTDDIFTGITGYFADFSAAMASASLTEPTTGGYYELVTWEGDATGVTSSESLYSGSWSDLYDGDASTYIWTNSAQAVGDYIQVDIGEEKTINTVRLTSPASSGDICTAADVRVSADGTNWTSVGSYTGSTSTTSITFTARSVRYIRVQITSAKPNWWKLSEIEWGTTSGSRFTRMEPLTADHTIENGTYIIVNGTNKAMNNTAGTNSGGATGLGYDTMTISGTQARPLHTDHEWTFTRNTDGSYYIQNASNAYLNVASNSVTTSSTAHKFTATIVNNKVLLTDRNTGYQINFYASNGQIFSQWNGGTSDSNNMMTLYKKMGDDSTLNTQDLYDAIQTAQALVDARNDDGRYAQSAFDVLYAELRAAKVVYETATDQAAIDAETAALLAAIEALKATDTTLNYIEIPVEFLDFRADGVMFEYAQNVEGRGGYEMLVEEKGVSNVALPLQDPVTGVTVRLPGELGDRRTPDEWNGWDTNCKRTGLVEDALAADGSPVYKEETVHYIALLIYHGYKTDLSSSVSNWNSTISDKVTALANNVSNYGSWETTLAKVGGTNGGQMAWNQVTTCFDLAYYILNNMWRSTTANDGENAYNKEVEERTTLRMLANETGTYTLDSTKEITYSGSYIYNTDLTTDNTAETKYNPLVGLGYESSEAYGDTTDTATGINYHFTMHAYGSFVYNADDNLYFEFDGDDDVYFYINGKLAMDLGGAHSHCDDRISLNDIADEFGLVDGGIYSFDMFYAERHSTQANLEFSTNIKIMDTKSITSKYQYDADGNVIPYGGIADAGDTVTYGFGLLNTRSVPVFDISFYDAALGATINKTAITLYDAGKTNGAATDITDITVYYHTYDRAGDYTSTGVINSDAAEDKTVDEITAMINAANVRDDTNASGSLPTGSYRVQITTEAELRSLLELGLPVDCQMVVTGVKRTVVGDDRPFINTVLSRAYYTSTDGRTNALNGTASQKLAVLNSFSDINKAQYVVDYGKAVVLNPSDIQSNIRLKSDVTASFVGITTAGGHAQIRTGTLSGVTASGELTTAAAKYTVNEGSITFQMNKMLSETQKFYAVYQIQDSAMSDSPTYESYYVLVEVDVIPATNVYYETDFADGVFALNDEWTTATVTGDAAADTTQTTSKVGEKAVYGYDASYDNDKYLSNGSSLKIDNTSGSTIQNATTFSFVGTGFDLISRTGVDQGAIRVDVYADEEMTNREKSVSVLNKSDGGLELYQIPVVSIENLDYGTHYVSIRVMSSYVDETYPSLNRGGEFYFDAIRIYDPAIDAAAIAAYKADDEYDPTYYEVRNLLISAESFGDGEAYGAVFVDYDYDPDDGDSFVTAVSDYKAVGPNNEVYLAKGQAVAFTVQAVTGTVTGVDLGAKTINGGTAKLCVSVGGTQKVNEQTIASATAQYYDIGTLAVGNTVVITNTGEDVLSITDLKVAGATISVVANDNTLAEATPALMMMLRLTPVEEPVEEEPAVFVPDSFSAKWRTFGTRAILTVTTSDDVKALTVNGETLRGRAVRERQGFGRNATVVTRYVWTYSTKTANAGDYEVIAYNADGVASEVYTATLAAKSRISFWPW